MTPMKIRWTSWLRFLDLRQKLFKAIKEVTEDSRSTWKSYEGRFDITFSLPNYFEEQESDAKAEWCIHLACYVIGPSRGSDWIGETFEEALDAAENDINIWLIEHEKWMTTKDADAEMEI